MYASSIMHPFAMFTSRSVNLKQGEDVPGNYHHRLMLEGSDSPKRFYVNSDRSLLGFKGPLRREHTVTADAIAHLHLRLGGSSRRIHLSWHWHWD
jgi:hypothetical protein